MASLFYWLSKVCACYQWEVIMAFIISLIAICSYDTKSLSQSLINSSSFQRCNQMESKSGHNCEDNEDHETAEVVVLTISQCLAILYVYYSFRSLFKLHEKYLLSLTAMFVVFSVFIFSYTVLTLFNGNLTQFFKALPLFLLLSDITKVSLLTRFTLSFTSRDELHDNIARGMAIIGPSLTFDSLVKTLAIGIGTLSGVTRIEMISYFACLSVIVNYLVFVLLFPACLSLALEILHKSSDEGVKSKWKLNVNVLQMEQTSNPFIKRIKWIILIMCGVMLVHSKIRCYLLLSSQKNDLNIIEWFFAKILAIGSEQMVMTAIVFVLAVKCVLFDNNDNFAEYISPETQQQIIEDTQNSGTENEIIASFSASETSTNNLIDDNLNHESHTLLNGEETYDGFYEIEFIDRNVQTDDSQESLNPFAERTQLRDISILTQLLESDNGVNELNDLEIVKLVENKSIHAYNLESILGNAERAVIVRRKLISKSSEKQTALNSVPYNDYDYSLVNGACCENVIGYIPVPLGVAGPLLLNGRQYFVPMATTEFGLIESTNLGCRALLMSGGVRDVVVKDGMTRGAVFQFPSAMRVVDAIKWLNEDNNFNEVAKQFESTSRFVKLIRIQTCVSGRYLFARFVATTGDAMGMNMLSKATESAIQEIRKHFADIEMTSLSGNYCTDKKPSAINWIEGRGKSVVCEAEVHENIVNEVLNTSIDALIKQNSSLLIGAAMAASIGGFNGRASSVVSAIYTACGQDIAQTVGSSNCMTIMERRATNAHILYITCTMPSIECGTVGGGTVLPAQTSCLELLGVKGSSQSSAGNNSIQLASIICATVLASELSFNGEL